jgi:PAS domain S-box-containing protein
LIRVTTAFPGQPHDATGILNLEKQEKNSGPRLTPERLYTALDATVFRVLRPGSISFAALYVFYAAAHWFLLPAPAKQPMTFIAYASAVVLLTFSILLRRFSWPVHWAHPLVAGIAWIVLGNCLAHMYFTSSPRQTMNLVLLVIGSGCVFLSGRWLALVLMTIFTGWWWTTWLLVKPAVMSYFDFELCAATALAVTVHALRLRTYTHLEELRVRDEHHNMELAGALQAAEAEIQERKRVETALEKAREELEGRVRERTGELAKTNETLRTEITERMRVEAALRKSEAKLVLAQRIGHVGSWELDLRAGTLHWSAESFRIFGHVPGEFVPSRTAFFEAVHPDDRAAVKKAMEEALKSFMVYYIDHRIVRPDGSERLVCERAEIICDSTGHPAEMIGTVQDITERKQLENQLRHSQKMDAIGQLAAGVAHDFNNILTVIKGHATLLHELMPNDSEHSDLLKEIFEATDRAANLIRQLLVFSRKKIIQTYTLDLNEVTRNLTKMLGRLLGEDITLSFQHSAGLPAVEADPGMLEQILLNLAINARDAMPGGGKLIISTETVVVDQKHTERNPEARPGHFVRLKVADTGCGIDPTVLPRIFEPFFTTKPVDKGTGLGLSTVYGIVRQHNGWIEVSSEVNRGTSFGIHFPVAPNLRKAIADKPAATEAARGTERILVVEDESAVRNLICRLLRRHGYTVFEAPSGAAALPVWKEHASEIDLLLTDLVMPGGVSGRQLADKCLADKPGLSVIYTSGYSADFGHLESSLGERRFFLAKPYQFPALAKLIRDCLDRRRPDQKKSA